MVVHGDKFVLLPYSFFVAFANFLKLSFFIVVFFKEFGNGSGVVSLPENGKADTFLVKDIGGLVSPFTHVADFWLEGRVGQVREQGVGVAGDSGDRGE
jgi:hypothetical protein